MELNNNKYDIILYFVCAPGALGPLRASTRNGGLAEVLERASDEIPRSIFTLAYLCSQFKYRQV